MNADGTNPRRVAWSLAEEQAPRFAPRGDALAFAGRDADGWGLYTVSVGAGGSASAAPLRVAGASRVPEASWDPSALLLAFADPAAGVVVATADGARSTVLPATGGLASVAWGPGRR
jgi:Tol biopolymer transport system component